MPFIFPYKVDATSGVSKWNLDEGEILLKDDLSTLTDPAGSMVSMNSLDQLNIREEGLDRRNFVDGKNIWADSPEPDFDNELIGILPISISPYEETWSELILSAGSPDWHPSIDGLSDVRLEIPWSVEDDTSVIIRCSFQIKDNNPFREKSNDMIDFGLFIVPPGESATAFTREVRTPSAVPGVFPYQRYFKNKAFGGDSFVYESDDDVHKSEWNRYGFDRRAGATQSFTLLAFASSDLGKSTSGSASSGYFFKDNGTAVAKLVCRRKLSSGTALETDRMDLEIFGLHFSYMKYGK